MPGKGSLDRDVERTAERCGAHNGASCLDDGISHQICCKTRNKVRAEYQTNRVIARSRHKATGHYYPLQKHLNLAMYHHLKTRG